MNTLYIDINKKEDIENFPILSSFYDKLSPSHTQGISHFFEPLIERSIKEGNFEKLQGIKELSTIKRYEYIVVFQSDIKEEL